MISSLSKIESLLRDLLAEERKLHQAYMSYLPLLHPSTLHDKMQEWVGEGGRHIEALQSALEERGVAIDQSASLPQATPEEIEAHLFLDYFYRAEERLYYHYQNGLKQAEEEGLRALVLSHLQDQEKHLSAIQHLYADFLYF